MNGWLKTSPKPRPRFGSLLMGMLLACAGVAIPSASQSERAPNILLILADDLGYGHLGCYGQEKIQTPHLDRLAERGMRFTQAYSGSTVCAPARSVLMTGYHSGHTPVRGNTGGIALRDGDLTMAEILQSAGYRTGLFGKWGLGDAHTEGAPNRQGFDEFFGYLHQRHAHFYYPDFLWENDRKVPLPGNRDGGRETYAHDVILKRSIEFIRESKDAPFFCFFSSILPHHEWIAPAETLAIYEGKFEENPPEYDWRHGYATPSAPKATMAAMITHLDKSIGELMHTLRDLGIEENTLVLFASDNGGGDYELACPEFFMANAPFRGYKGDLYEGGIRVPAIASWPGKVKPGTVSERVWYFPDLMPTFADLAGASDLVPKDCDGLSISSILSGGEAPEHRFLYWESGDEDPKRALRMGDWKAIWPKTDSAVELYDLSVDPGETNNVAEEHAEIVAEMRGLMESNHAEAPPQIEPDMPDARYYY